MPWFKIHYKFTLLRNEREYSSLILAKNAETATTEFYKSENSPSLDFTITGVEKVESVRVKFTLRRVYLDSGGYANHGRDYFGHGTPLYYYETENEDVIRNYDYIRAPSREKAKEKVRKDQHGNYTLGGKLIECVFYR